MTIARRVRQPGNPTAAAGLWCAVQALPCATTAAAALAAASASPR
jgi:hypothetical protein